MRKLVLLAGLILCVAPPLRADEQIRSVQAELKTQGFYYGAVDGQPGAETTAAIRRYQIRNGLEVTGQLNQETLASLRLGGADEKTKSAARDENNLRVPPEEKVQESDREFLQREIPARRQPAVPETPPVPPVGPVLPPPVPMEPPAPAAEIEWSALYAHTPYETAPPEVQQQTLKLAQSRLARGGYYRGVIDGLPGSETERALLRFQQRADLRLTGRLDIETLGELGLLPGTRYAHPLPGESLRPPPIRRTYRGIWVQ